MGTLTDADKDTLQCSKVIRIAWKSKSKPKTITKNAKLRELSEQIKNECLKYGYEILNKVLGKGAYANVYLANVVAEKLFESSRAASKLREYGKTVVAIKVIYKSDVPVEFLRKFLPREVANHLSLPPHRHIVRCFEHFSSKHHDFLVLEYCCHGDLLDRINWHIHHNEKYLPVKFSKRVFYQLTKAVKHCHDHLIVHRDLKCENILLDEKDNIKLTDFGFSTKASNGEFLRTACGSFAYAAPEVTLGNYYNGEKADIWSLGVILFAMVNGRLPFPEQKNYHNNNGDDAHFQYNLTPTTSLSTACISLIRKLLSQDPEQRPSITRLQKHPWLSQFSNVGFPPRKQSQGYNPTKSFNADLLERTEIRTDSILTYKWTPNRQSAITTHSPPDIQSPPDMQSPHAASISELSSTTQSAIESLTCSSKNLSEIIRTNITQPNAHHHTAQLSQPNVHHHTAQLSQPNAHHHTPQLSQLNAHHHTPQLFQPNAHHHTPQLSQPNTHHHTPQLSQPNAHHHTPQLSQPNAHHHTPQLSQRNVHHHRSRLSQPNAHHHTTQLSQINDHHHTTQLSQPNAHHHTSQLSQPYAHHHTTQLSQPNAHHHTPQLSQPNIHHHTSRLSQPNARHHTSRLSQPNVHHHTPQLSQPNAHHHTPRISLHNHSSKISRETPDELQLQHVHCDSNLDSTIMSYPRYATQCAACPCNAKMLRPHQSSSPIINYPQTSKYSRTKSAWVHCGTLLSNGFPSYTHRCINNKSASPLRYCEQREGESHPTDIGIRYPLKSRNHQRTPTVRHPGKLQTTNHEHPDCTVNFSKHKSQYNITKSRMRKLYMQQDDTILTDCPCSYYMVAKTKNSSFYNGTKMYGVNNNARLLSGEVGTDIARFSGRNVLKRPTNVLKRPTNVLKRPTNVTLNMNNSAAKKNKPYRQAKTRGVKATEIHDNIPMSLNTATSTSSSVNHLYFPKLKVTNSTCPINAMTFSL